MLNYQRVAPERDFFVIVPELLGSMVDFWDGVVSIMTDKSPWNPSSIISLVGGLEHFLFLIYNIIYILYI